MTAPRPTAWTPLTFLQLLLSPTNPTFSGGVLLCVLNPANEFVTGQRRDVFPSVKGDGIGHQDLLEICGEYMYHPARYSSARHRYTVPVKGAMASWSTHLVDAVQAIFKCLGSIMQ